MEIVVASMLDCSKYISMDSFFQEPPKIENTFLNDPLLKGLIKTHFTGHKDFAQIETQFALWGELASTEWLRLAEQANRQRPQLISFDPWGRRIDQIQVSDAWKKLESIAATEGVVARAYTREYGEKNRISQMALLYLYHSSSALYSCPLAMTDGAARVLEKLGSTPEQKNAFQHLISRDPKSFWTSGQWMTEKTGGSDVSLSQTHAVKTADGYALHGTKWFTSATTSQMAMALAKTSASQNSGELSLFFVPLRNEKGELNNIQIHRLKDKMGTHALPTAELSLNGTPAQMVGPEGQGVKSISTILNVTRIYNSICSISQARRALDYLQSYSKIRFAFGKMICQQPLHKKLLSDLEALYTRLFNLTFFAVSLLGKEEAGTISDVERKTLRMITPVTKLYTAKKGYEIIAECIEGFGGVGYIEDSGLPTLLRDMMALVIWEGTTNVLSLDLLRSLKDPGTFEILNDKFKDSKNKNYQDRWNHLAKEIQADPIQGQAHARDLSYLVAELYAETID
jgi:putative acyl-CoA dehydrogenase